MKCKRKQYIGFSKLQTLGFVAVTNPPQKNVFCLKRGQTILATIALDETGRLINATGLRTNEFGNVVLYQRY